AFEKRMGRLRRRRNRSRAFARRAATRRDAARGDAHENDSRRSRRARRRGVRAARGRRVFRARRIMTALAKTFGSDIFTPLTSPDARIDWLDRGDIAALASAQGGRTATPEERLMLALLTGAIDDLHRSPALRASAIE